ncbi:MAG TPA: 4-hydroxy-3-methylbut-2-enyl diphosphate reductase [Acidimicrobiales bacterium]|nr:4-hydroxy-3-methylbut-2-enyl diphosphate reductase [Acidimicrobiales bacterium]
MQVEKVLLARPRGFCAGVEMAIKALAWMVRVFEPPVYCYHEIVHNQLVVEEFARLGVVFVEDVNEVPEGGVVMLSAHGTAPQVEHAARSGRMVVNAACPLVTKVHHELKVRAKRGYTVIYVGHEGHQESIGTMAVAPQAVRLVETEADVDELDDPGTPVALLAQTTLSHDDWSGVMEHAKARFPDIWMPGRADLCYATTNRQSAVRVIAPRVDAFVVIGSSNSSNTVSLTKVAKRAGCKHVLRVDRADQLPDDLSGTVGVTAGASAPEWVVEEVIAKLAPSGGVEPVDVLLEDEYFPPPRELRDVLKSAAVAAALLVGGDPTAEPPLGSDRSIPASAVLGAPMPAAS